MRILLTNIQLNARSGTEIVIRDLALGLRESGCEPIIYCSHLGCMSDEIVKSGIPVVSSLENVKIAPDVIHGHHHVETLAALHRFPGVPGIFVCHDAGSWADFAPVHPMLRTYVAVDFNCRERLIKEALLKEEEICVIGNAVDMKRFQQRPPLPKKAVRAVVFSSYAKPGDAWLEAIRGACDAEKISLEVIGAGVGRLCERPETILGGFDLVFGKARCVIEALATGGAAIMCDFRGLGGMVTPENVEHALNWNCGARLLTRKADVDNVRAEIRRYDPAAARAVSDLVRQRRGLDQSARAYRSLYEAALQPSEEMKAFASRWEHRAQYQLMARKEVAERLLNPALSSVPSQPDMPRLTPSDLAGI
jgi:hypothetical protein